MKPTKVQSARSHFDAALEWTQMKSSGWQETLIGVHLAGVFESDYSMASCRQPVVLRHLLYVFSIRSQCVLIADRCGFHCTSHNDDILYHRENPDYHRICAGCADYNVLYFAVEKSTLAHARDLG